MPRALGTGAEEFYLFSGKSSGCPAQDGHESLFFPNRFTAEFNTGILRPVAIRYASELIGTVPLNI